MMKSGLDEHVQLLSALSDATRLRLLALLAEHELSVIELTQVTELGQSKVSMHLARLREQGLVIDRKAGTSAYYRLNALGLSVPMKRLWETLHATLDDAGLLRDRERAQRVIEGRDKKTWPERMAGELEHHYSPGRTWDALARAFAGLTRTGDVLDVGAGDGTVAELLAPSARAYTCLDVSATLSLAARNRLARLSNVQVLRADMHTLPFAARSFDQVLLLNVLAYAARPNHALDEAVRVLRKHGELLLVTLAKHEHLDVAAQYGHAQPGFEIRWLRKRLTSQGMQIVRCAVTSREKQRPHFEIITCLAKKSD